MINSQVDCGVPADVEMWWIFREGWGSSIHISAIQAFDRRFTQGLGQPIVVADARIPGGHELGPLGMKNLAIA